MQVNYSLSPVCISPKKYTKIEVYGLQQELVTSELLCYNALTFYAEFQSSDLRTQGD
jgi:hypothetical protein